MKLPARILAEIRENEGACPLAITILNTWWDLAYAGVGSPAEQGGGRVADGYMPDRLSECGL